MKMADTKTRELFIYDDIGPEWAGMIGAQSVVEELDVLGPGPVNVRVNSYGGSADEALSMLEVLGRHDGEIKVSVDSIAASAASLFPVAFESTAAKHARIMVHNPWTIAIGYASDLRKTADVLDAYRDSIASVYAMSMTVSETEILEIMDEESWYSATDAQEIGLVDSVTETAEPVAAKAIPADRFKNTPDDLLSKDPPKKLDIETPQRIAAKLRVMKIKANLRKRS